MLTFELDCRAIRRDLAASRRSSSKSTSTSAALGDGAAAAYRRAGFNDEATWMIDGFLPLLTDEAGNA